MDNALAVGEEEEDGVEEMLARDDRLPTFI